LSRFSETRPDLLIEFVDGGYIALGDPQKAAIREAKKVIPAIVPEGEAEAISLEDVGEASKIPRATLQRTIEELIEERTLNRTGKGKRGSPYLYFRPQNRFCPTSSLEGQQEKEPG
jgi:hypothetical protein